VSCVYVSLCVLSLCVSLCESLSVSISDSLSLQSEDSTSNTATAQVRQRGARFAIAEIASSFGETLPQRLPSLWPNLDLREGASACVLLCALLPSLHPLLLRQLSMESVIDAVTDKEEDVRKAAAELMCALCMKQLQPTMIAVVRLLLPRLRSPCLSTRQGSSYCLCLLVIRLRLRLLPYCCLLYPAFMYSMSDSCRTIRGQMSQCFAAVIELMPLELGQIDDCSDLPSDLIERRNRQRQFFRQLSEGPGAMEPYEGGVRLNAELRAYQQVLVLYLYSLLLCSSYSLFSVLCYVLFALFSVLKG